MTLQETHDRIDELIEQAEYDSKAARNPKIKNRYKTTLEFFKAIKKHLKPIK